MQTTVSRDGTPIAFDRAGQGPPLVLVVGALTHRRFGPAPPLARLLTGHFTVFTYDRRGRGDSGDTAPYAVEREVDDLGAVIEAAGGSAYVYGTSSGAALALEAAAHLKGIEKLALHEPPFIVDDSRPPRPDDYLPRMEALVAADRRGEAVKMFLISVGAPAPVVAVMRLTPVWRKLKATAHTLPYDLRILDDYGKGRPLPAERWRTVTAATLVLDGGKSPAWMRNAMRHLTEVLPDAQRRTLPGQTHQVKASAVAPVLTEFFAG